MYNPLVFGVALALSGLLAVDGSFFYSWNCPANPVEERVKPHKKGKLHGPCAPSFSGIEAESCRNEDLSCCKNIHGEYLCVKKPVWFPTWPLRYTTSPPDPRCPSPLTLMSTVGLWCSVEGVYQRCEHNNECEPGKVCCSCLPGTKSNKICYPENRSFDSSRGLIVNPNADAGRGIIITSEPDKHEVKSEKAVEERPAEELPPNVQTVEDDVIDEQSLEGNELPPSQVPVDVLPNGETKQPNDLVDPAEEGTSDELEEACPKPIIMEDGAVGCPAYGPEIVECVDGGCDTGSVCCKDACPGSDIMLCFPLKNSTNEAVALNLVVDPPSTPVEPPAKESEEPSDEQDSRFKCPAGDFTSCIAWAQAQNKDGSEVPGTGTCKSNKDCAEGRLCCKITECNDGIKHCVPRVDKSSLQPRCPIPSWSKVHDAKPCKRGCNKGQICCDVDMQGTKGCVDPELED